MVQWEYRIISGKPNQLSVMLVPLGIEGWEACGMAIDASFQSNKDFNVLLKRPISPNNVGQTPNV